MDMFELTKIKGIGNSTLKKLKKAKIQNLEDSANSTPASSIILGSIIVS